MGIKPIEMRPLTLLIVLFYSFLSVAQYGYKDEKIASRFRPGMMWYNTGWKPAEEGKDRKYDRLIVDLSYQQWINNGNLSTNASQSIGWGVHTMWDIPLTTGNSISIGTGLSYKHRRIGLQGVFSQFIDSSVYHPEYTEPQSLDKQVLGMHTVSIPLELRFRPKKFKQIVKFHVGASVGYSIQSYHKMWFQHHQTVIKNKQLDDFNSILVGAHARLGFRNWALFGDYQLTPLFKSSNSARGSILSVGISLSLF